jgi:hypothetical protein
VVELRSTTGLPFQIFKALDVIYINETHTSHSVIWTG